MCDRVLTCVTLYARTDQAAALGGHRRT
jgi:hypothetical protein